ncbi:TetR/AcrR family transcriptional regulator [Kribbella sp. NPDC058245]|uniref:TetR/AcrR family transcriptional regulator n=1 Tax=Kribbella sp. NPDC058245 TaxID=3346399 RepID=UPI0036E40DDB
MTETPLRDRLVQAGVELLESEGLTNLTLRAITRRTGVSHGAPRRYFPTHNALLAAIAATGLADLATRLALPVDGSVDGSVEERLVAAAERYLEFAAERPGMFDLIFRHDLLEGAGGNLRAQSLPLLQTFIDLVAESHPADAQLRAVALWTNLHGLTTLRATKTLELLEGLDLPTLVRQIVRTHLTLSGPST